MDGLFMRFPAHVLSDGQWSLLPPATATVWPEGWQENGWCPPGQPAATCMAAAQVEATRYLSHLRGTQNLHQPFLTWD